MGMYKKVKGYAWKGYNKLDDKVGFGTIKNSFDPQKPTKKQRRIEKKVRSFFDL